MNRPTTLYKFTVSTWSSHTKTKPVEQHADVTRGKNEMFTKQHPTQYQVQWGFVAYADELTWSFLGNHRTVKKSESTMFPSGDRDFHVVPVPFCSIICGDLLLTSMFATDTLNPTDVIHRRILDERIKADDHSVLWWIVEDKETNLLCGGLWNCCPHVSSEAELSYSFGPKAPRRIAQCATRTRRRRDDHRQIF